MSWCKISEASRKCNKYVFTQKQADPASPRKKKTKGLAVTKTDYVAVEVMFDFNNNNNNDKC